jgi:hypothetical protein
MRRDVTDKEVIQIIREEVRAVQEEGESSIPAEALQRLLNHLDSGQVDRDLGLIVAAQRERATAKYRGRAESGLELFKSAIQSGHASSQIFIPAEWRRSGRCSGVSRTS